VVSLWAALHLVLLRYVIGESIAQERHDRAEAALEDYADWAAVARL
jgi:hypothetical protein